MNIHQHDSPLEFRDQVLAFLCEEEASNCMLLSWIDNLLKWPERYPRFYLYSVADNGHVCGAALMTPPRHFGITRMPLTALPRLLEKTLAISDPISGLYGPVDTVTPFKDLWLHRRSERVVQVENLRLFQLDHVTPVRSVEGEMRLANELDLALLKKWGVAFVEDCKLDDPPDETLKKIEFSVLDRQHYVWEVRGEPVSMAGFSAKTPSGIGVIWVYTPSDLRRRGYASALVAALSKKALDDGKRHCFLHTDAENPTSNHIYQQIGYQFVGDFRSYLLGT